MTSAYNSPLLFDGHRIRKDVSIHISKNLITQVAPANASLPSLPSGYLVAPGLIDIQVNGGGGKLFNDSPDEETAAYIADSHALAGTTTLLVTLITDELSKLDNGINAVQHCIKSGHPGIAGIHLEGPYIDPQRRGIHSEQWIQSGESLNPDQLCNLKKDGITLITLAPEHVHPQKIKDLTQSGAIVFAGHTNCTDAEFKVALDAGVQGVTHLFNAMSQIGPRQMGVTGTTLINPNIWAGIILDGHHVGIENFKLVTGMGRMERTILVSDAMGVAASSITEFDLYGEQIKVVDGRCLNTQNVLAGSSVTLSECVRIAIRKYGLAAEDALASASTRPAELLGLQTRKGYLRIGHDADLVVFDGQFHVAGCMQAGRWIHANDTLRESLQMGGAH